MNKIKYVANCNVLLSWAFILWGKNSFVSWRNGSRVLSLIWWLRNWIVLGGEKVCVGVCVCLCKDHEPNSDQEHETKPSVLSQNTLKSPQSLLRLNFSDPSSYVWHVDFPLDNTTWA